MDVEQQNKNRIAFLPFHPSSNPPGDFTKGVCHLNVLEASQLTELALSLNQSHGCLHPKQVSEPAVGVSSFSGGGERTGLR